MPPIHETVSGHEIRYEADAKLTRFLERVRKLAEDPKVPEGELVAAIYGSDNPLLGPSIVPTLPGLGAITKETLAHPAYRVMQDLLYRKRVEQRGWDIEKTAAKFTLTVAEGAARAGVTVDALHKAIREGRIASWKKGGQYYLDPRSLSAHEFGRRGPVGASALEYRVGYVADADAFLRVRFPTGVLPSDRFDKSGLSVDGKITQWQRVAVLTGGQDTIRFFELEPANEVNAISHLGFYVKGGFRKVRTINNPKAAREAWEEFKAS